MLAHPNISVMTNAAFRNLHDFIPHRPPIYTGGTDEDFDFASAVCPIERRAQAQPDVWFVGRLATSRSYSMNPIVGRALAT